MLQSNIKLNQLIELAGTLLNDQDIVLISNVVHYIDIELSEQNTYMPYYYEIAQTGMLHMNLAGKAISSTLLYYSLGPHYDKNKLTTLFGEKILTIVEGIRKIRSIDTTKATSQAENFIKLFLSQTDDVRSILIVIAEKFYAIKNLQLFPDEEKKKLCHEISVLYAPLAHRLGLYTIKTEMEELSMKHLHYDTYKFIAGKLAETKKARESYIDKFLIPIKTQLDKHHFVYEIKSRPKSIFSIWKKLQKSRLEFENIYDLFAIRIILDCPIEEEKSQCWQVYSIVSDIFTPSPNRLRDWISTPKASGYESLHTTVLGPENKWVEVQIRTKRMDEIAEKGIAAHWKYKSVKPISSESWLERVRQAIENPDTDAFEEEHEAKQHFYSGEIFVFTPQGDLRRMPQNSTVLDFAYEIHSDIGDTCIGALVNKKIVPLKHKLSNGDRIEILTSKNQTPKQDWLNFTTTRKAHLKIKRFLKDQENKDAELGKEILKRKLTQIKTNPNDDVVQKLINHYKLRDVIELYVQIARNQINTNEFRSILEGVKQEPQKLPEKVDIEDFSEKFKRRVKQDQEDYLLIDEKIDNLDFKLAKCCNPIKGDDIFGFVAATGGIKIHRVNCPNAMQLTEKYPYRIIKAKWKRTSASGNFGAGIRVIATDDVSIVNNITQLFTKEKDITVRGINMHSNDGIFEGNITLFVSDAYKLEDILKKIKSLKGVHSATRYNV
ncbi:MAG: RelA/SpoT family protein [Bacteroidales bacterium]